MHSSPRTNENTTGEHDMIDIDADEARLEDLVCASMGHIKLVMGETNNKSDMYVP